MESKIQTEIGELLLEFEKAGWQITISRYDAKAFGNFIVKLQRKDRILRIVKDRSCYELCDSNGKCIISAALEVEGDDARKAEFVKQVLDFLRDNQS